VLLPLVFPGHLHFIFLNNLRTDFSVFTGTSTGTRSGYCFNSNSTFPPSSISGVWFMMYFFWSIFCNPFRRFSFVKNLHKMYTVYVRNSQEYGVNSKYAIKFVSRNSMSKKEKTSVRS
jgi:hypothetical protein